MITQAEKIASLKGQLEQLSQKLKREKTLRVQAEKKSGTTDLTVLVSMFLQLK